MASPHESKYQFIVPESISEATDRMMILLRDIWNIEKQLGDAVRYTHEGVELTAQEFNNWHSRISASRVFKMTEYQALKHWRKEARRRNLTKKLGIEDPNNPTELLIVARTILDDVLEGKADPDKIGRVFTAIERYLVHIAPSPLPSSQEAQI